MEPLFNKRVIMSGAQYMTNSAAINAYMHHEPFNVSRAVEQHQAIKQALTSIGINVVSVPPPSSCQDGVFTANWGLVKDNKVLIASLPNVRKPEEKYAEHVLRAMGLETFRLPRDSRFSGQGDALPCGDYVFIGTGYRTDEVAHQEVEKVLGYRVIAVKTVPALDKQGNPLINEVTGWPDSLFYDLDLAIAVIYPPDNTRKGLIAWCRQAFTKDSQKSIDELDFVDKIEVPYDEAVKVSALNLVSSGHSVVMNSGAEYLKTELQKRDIGVVCLHNEELAKNGGSVRCCSLTID